MKKRHDSFLSFEPQLIKAMVIVVPCAVQGVVADVKLVGVPQL